MKFSGDTDYAATGLGSGVDFPLAEPDLALPAELKQGEALDSRLIIFALFALSLTLYGAGWVISVPALRLIGVFGVAIFGVGAAPFQCLPKLEAPARLGLSALVGFTCMMGFGALMADVRAFWHPAFVGAILGLAALGGHLWIGFARPWSFAVPRWRVLLTGRNHADLRWWSATGLVVAGSTIWLVSALLDGHVVPGIGGFPAQITPLWFVGVLLILVAIAVASDGRMLGWAVTSLALATTLTPALVYGEPRSESAGKQIKLVLVILGHHHIDPKAGIYQAYSVFFAGIAWVLHLAATTNCYGLAAFWPVIMALVRVVELRFLVGRVATSPLRRWWAVTLVILVDCIGADYFSPQSLGYVVVLALLALVVRGRVGVGLSKRVTFVILLAGALMLGPEHELSPFIAAGVMLVLAVFGEAPRWAFVVTAAPAVAWAGFEDKIVSHAFSLAQVFSVSNFAPPQTAANPGLSRMAIVSLSSHALLLGLVVLLGLAMIGFIAHIRDKRKWAYGICAGTGLVFVAINPYGNEGIFRAALFGIPWLAILASFIPSFRPLPRRRLFVPASMLATSIGLLATFCVGAYGMDSSDVMSRADYRAGQLFVTRAPRDSFMLTLGYGDSPANAPLFSASDTSLTWSQVIDSRLVASGRPVASDMSRLIRDYERVAASHEAKRSSAYYLLWSPTLLRYSEEYGLQSAAQTRQWLALLRRGRRWILIFHQHGTYLFRLRHPRYGGRD